MAGPTVIADLRRGVLALQQLSATGSLTPEAVGRITCDLKINIAAVEAWLGAAEVGRVHELPRLSDLRPAMGPDRNGKGVVLVWKRPGAAAGGAS